MPAASVSSSEGAAGPPSSGNAKAILLKCGYTAPPKRASGVKSMSREKLKVEGGGTALEMGWKSVGGTAVSTKVLSTG